jgi:hypothetical protein
VSSRFGDVVILCGLVQRRSAEGLRRTDAYGKGRIRSNDAGEWHCVMEDP